MIIVHISDNGGGEESMGKGKYKVQVNDVEHHEGRSYPSNYQIVNSTYEDYKIEGSTVSFFTEQNGQRPSLVVSFNVLQVSGS